VGAVYWLVLGSYGCEAACSEHVPVAVGVAAEVGCWSAARLPGRLAQPVSVRAAIAIPATMSLMLLSAFL
jgi:hypothetical protein